MIIDAHAHLSPTSYGNAEQYVAALAKSGISMGVVCPGGMLDVRRMNDFVFGAKKSDTKPKNDYVARSLQKHKQLRGIVCVDPYDPGARDELLRYRERGLLGLFVSPLVHPFSFTDDEMIELARLAAAHKMPIISHNGWRKGANTADFAALAAKVPEASFLLEHLGAHPADAEARDMAVALPNFFLETSLGSFLQLVETLKEAGAQKVVFGSEYPLSDPGVELAKINLLPISREERGMILCGNARRLFGIDFRHQETMEGCV